jgi:hypothetical protein
MGGSHGFRLGSTKARAQIGGAQLPEARLHIVPVLRKAERLSCTGSGILCRVDCLSDIYLLCGVFHTVVFFSRILHVVTLRLYTGSV